MSNINYQVKNMKSKKELFKILVRKEDKSLIYRRTNRNR